ncbi:MAG: hypothetical protein A2075_00745 [Geobacteraceae bacterium GWC2_58_44]|nr:MAG: hypothetical protein A2075_00745 [Geobacteraceae bacterium GWC2_58_44]HBG06223.1 hypothetical protein [Geobacter sp.]
MSLQSKYINEVLINPSTNHILKVGMPIILLLTLGLSLHESFGEEKRLDTVAGEIRYIRNEKTSRCNVLLDNKSILKMECEFAYLPEIRGDFRENLGKFDEVVVLQENPMGNACNGGPLHLIGLRKDKSYQVSGPLDFCGGKDPIIKHTGEMISIIFPGGPPNRGTGDIPTEKWIFGNGKLKKTK